MTRKRKGRTKTREQRALEQLEREFDDALGETVTNYCCTNKTALEFAGQCESDSDDLEIALRFNRLALEIWSQIPSDHARELVAVLRELADERQRHGSTLAMLHARFNALANQGIHEHLEPERYEELVFERLFAEPESESESEDAPRLVSP